MTKLGVFFAGHPGHDYIIMFQSKGWQRVGSVEEADLVQFTGGADVNPALYGKPRHNTTRYNVERDRLDCAIWRLARDLKKPMAGICRGGQFLNVMCGGEMWQDVNAHAIHGGHDMYNLMKDTLLSVTSTHHQMMIPGEHAQILGVACESSRRERVTENGGMYRELTKTYLGQEPEDQDIEVLWYPGEQCLCFQPHPEFFGEVILSKCYFDFLTLLVTSKETNVCAD